MNVYRALLHLYPSSYSAEYGDEMCGVFEQQLPMASGTLAKCGLWIAAFFEVLSNAVAVHWQIAQRDFALLLPVVAAFPRFRHHRDSAHHLRHRSQCRHLYASRFCSGAASAVS
jgi:hypothetical protein